MFPLDELDHVRGPSAAALVLEYGDYECPYSHQAFREIQSLERRPRGLLRFVFRHFPLAEIHPHALAASAAAEAAALQGKFWQMHELLFHRQRALEDADLGRYASELELDVDSFEADRQGKSVHDRIARDIESGTAPGEVRGTPTLFINGVIHLGPRDAAALLEALKREPPERTRAGQ